MFSGLFHLSSGTLKLPFLIEWGLFALIVSVCVGLILVPLSFMARNEFKDWKDWLQERKTLWTSHNARNHGMLRIPVILDAINQALGQLTAWLGFFMVLTQFVVVLMRYVFSIGSIPMQESIWYMHGLLFTLGSGYTLMKEGHIRVDIFYRSHNERKKAFVNLMGILLFLFPVTFYGFVPSWSYVLHSWQILEKSTEGSGLPFVYLLKTAVLFFFGSLILQGLSLGIHSFLVCFGFCSEPQQKQTLVID